MIDRRSAIVACLIAFFGKAQRTAPREGEQHKKNDGDLAFGKGPEEIVRLEVLLCDAGSNCDGISNLTVTYKDKSVTISAAEIFEALMPPAFRVYP